MSGDGSGTGVWDNQVDLPEEDKRSAAELVILMTFRHQGNAVELARVLDVLGLVEIFYEMLDVHQLAPAAAAFQAYHDQWEEPSTKPR